MLSYRVILDVPLPLVLFVSGLLAEHRGELGTRSGTRALSCWKQAVFALAWFRDRPDIRRLGQGFGISQALVLPGARPYLYTGTGVMQWIPDVGSWARTAAPWSRPLRSGRPGFVFTGGLASLLRWARAEGLEAIPGLCGALFHVRR